LVALVEKYRGNAGIVVIGKKYLGELKIVFS
jgi:hypothetical protein